MVRGEIKFSPHLFCNSIIMTLKTKFTEEEKKALIEAGCSVFTSPLGIVYVFDEKNRRIEFEEEIDLILRNINPNP